MTDNNLAGINGMIAQEGSYSSIILGNQQKEKLLEKERTKLQKKMNDMIKAGASKNSSAVQEMQIKINEVTENQKDTINTIEQARKDSLELEWKRFDKISEFFDRIPNELQFLVDNLSKEDLYHELDHYYDSDIAQGRNVSGQMREYANIGKLNDTGIAVGGLRLAKYEAYLKEIEQYEKQLAIVQEQLNKNPYDSDIRAQYNTYLQGYQSAVSNAQEEKYAIKSLIQDGYSKQLEAINKIIDARKESLQAAKDLYDYEQSMEDKQKSINSYKKQLLSLKGDNSEEAQAKRQTIQKNLDDAQKDLKSTQMDKQISMQGEMLDKLYSRLQEIINRVSGDTNQAVKELEEQVRDGSYSIKGTIDDATEKWHYTMTSDTSKLVESISKYGNYTIQYNGSLDALGKEVKDILNKILKKFDDFVNGKGMESMNLWNSMKEAMYDKNGNLLYRYSSDKHGYTDTSKDIEKLNKLLEENDYDYADPEVQKLISQINDEKDKSDKNYEQRVRARKEASAEMKSLTKTMKSQQKTIDKLNSDINKWKNDLKKATSKSEKEKLHEKINNARDKRSDLKQDIKDEQKTYDSINQGLHATGEARLDYVDDIQNNNLEWRQNQRNQGIKEVDKFRSSYEKEVAERKKDKTKLTKLKNELKSASKTRQKEIKKQMKAVEKDIKVLNADINKKKDVYTTTTSVINYINNGGGSGDNINEAYENYIDSAASGAADFQKLPDVPKTSSSSSSSSNKSSSSSSNKSSSGWKAPSKLSGFEHGATNNKYKNATTLHGMLAHRGYDVSGKDSDFRAIAKAITGKTYNGSKAQNKQIRDYLKKHKFAEGGTIGKIIKGTGEDGFILARTGEEVLSIPKLKLAGETVDKLINASIAMPNNAIRTMNTTNAMNQVGDIQFIVEEMNLPNVRDSKEFANDFVNVLKTDSRIQKAIRSVSVDMVNGGNSFNVRRF